MFRRAATYAAKMVAGVGSLQLGAAAVALTDKELGKKPEWYKNDVLALEDSLKRLSTYAFIEKEEVLKTAEENFKRYVDTNNPEILWRLARALAEKSELTKCEKTKTKLLHEAVEYADKSIKYGGKNAQAYKWYAIAASRLAQVDKKASKCPKLREKVQTYLKQATEIDSKDPFAWHLLGVTQFKDKDYKNAIESFKKAESIKPGFSLVNSYYLGYTQWNLGQKNEAKESLKKAFNLPIKNKLDSKAKSDTKSLLVNKFKLKVEEFEIKEEY